MRLDTMKQEPGSPTSMQETFGCAVENRFYQLLDDESDPLDFLHQQAEEKSRRKKKDEAAAAKKVSSQKGGKKESQKERKAVLASTEVPPTAQIGQKHAPKQVGKGSQNENIGSEVKVDRTERRTAFREFRPNIMEKPMEYSIEKPLDNVDREKQMRTWVSGRGGIRGRGRGGFPRNAEGENLRGKREFDRHSGSDRAIRAEDKRGGSGPRNWGSIKDAFSEAEPAPVEEHVEISETVEATEEERDAKVPGEISDGFTQEMTLDEWKSIQDQSRPKTEFNLRKTESSVPSKAVVIHKSKYKNNLNENEEVDYQYCFRKPVNDITTQLDINFGSLTRPSRGGRGGRGRVRREEAFPHEVVNAQPHFDAPNPDDPEDFPALA
ncbi:intracellular hyaluronan-binding protein 4 isoform 2-T2 [Rhinophrynus dorsalis]